MEGRFTHADEKRILRFFQDRLINRTDHFTKGYLDRNKVQKFYSTDTSGENTDDLLLRHLRGEDTYGSYAYNPDTRRTLFACLDCDENVADFEKNQVRFLQAVVQIKQHLIRQGVPEKAILLVFSGRRGYHLWICFSQPVEVYALQGFMWHATATIPRLETPVRIDCYPHQATDPAVRPFGNAPKLPLCKHLGSGNWSSFIDDEGNDLNAVTALDAVEPWCFEPLPWVEKMKGPGKGKRGKRSKGSISGTEREMPVVPTSRPRMTPEIGRLFGQCEFMKRFSKEPEAVSHADWTRAGIVLCQLEEMGEEWFTWLSVQDIDRFDGSHEELIRNVREQDMRAPSCRTLGCNLCHLKSPLQATGRSVPNFRPVFCPEEDELDEVSLEEYRQELEAALRVALAERKPIIWLVRSPTGSGKTTIVRQVLEDMGRRVLWWGPAYSQLEEFENALSRPHHPIRGLKRMIEHGEVECLFQADMEKRILRGLPHEKPYCHKGGLCGIRDSCAYQRQFAAGAKVPFVTAVHHSLRLNVIRHKLLCADRDVVVFDECFLSQYREEKTLTREQLETLKEVLSETSGGRRFIDSWIEPLLTLLDSGKGGRRLRRMVVEKPLRQAVIERYEDNKELGRNVLGDLTAAARERYRLKVRREGDEDILWFSSTSYLPTNKPIFILDGTGDPDHYKAVLGDKFEIREIDPLGSRRLPQHVRVRQILNGGYSNTTTLTEEGELSESGWKLARYMRSRMKSEASIGIIATEKMETALRREFEGMDIVWGHFNNIRGMNGMQDVDQLFVVGYQGIPHEALREEARVLFDRESLEGLQNGGIKVGHRYERLKYRHQSGLGWEVRVPCFEDDLIDRLFRHKCISEVVQACDRARILRETERQRELFILTNIPTPFQVDEVIDLHDHEMTRTLEQLHEAAQGLLSEQSEFSREDLKDRSGLSQSTVRKNMNRLTDIMKLNVYTETKTGRETYCLSDENSPSRHCAPEHSLATL